MQSDYIKTETDGGEIQPREKPSKHGRDQQLYSHKLQVRQSTRDYTQVVTNPIKTPSDLGAQ